jgi:hypothetical protein
MFSLKGARFSTRPGPSAQALPARTVYARAVRATGARVVVLGPTPKPRVGVPDCLAEHLRIAIACATPRQVALDTSGVRAERQAVLRAGGSYLDVAPGCAPGQPARWRSATLLAYRDDNHLTTSCSSWLAPLLGCQLDQTVRASRRRPSG